MQSGQEHIQFFFGHQVVGYFEDQPPSSPGEYRYMPFRGPGHFLLGQELNRKGPQYCHYVADGEPRNSPLRAYQDPTSWRYLSWCHRLFLASLNRREFTKYPHLHSLLRRLVDQVDFHISGKTNIEGIKVIEIIQACPLGVVWLWTCWIHKFVRIV